MAESHFEKASQYIRERATWTDAENEVALDQMGEMRCPLVMTSTGEKICDEIHDLLEEYGEEHDLAEGWWLDYGDEEDWFLNL